MHVRSSEFIFSISAYNTERNLDFLLFVMRKIHNMEYGFQNFCVRYMKTDSWHPFLYDNVEYFRLLAAKLEI